MADYDELGELMRDLGPEVIRDAEWRTAVLPKGRHADRVRRSRRRWQQGWEAAIDATTVSAVRAWGQRHVARYAHAEEAPRG